MIDASALQSIVMTAAGTNADITTGVIGRTTDSKALQTVSFTATGGATINPNRIDSSTSNLDSVLYSATGTGSIITPAGILDTTNSGINSLTLTSADRGSLIMASGSTTIGSGLLAAVTMSATNRGTITLNGWDAAGTSSTAAGNYSFSSGTRGTLDFGNATVLTNGNVAALTVNVGADSTMAFGTGVLGVGNGTITDTVITVGADATTSGELSVGEAGTGVHTDAAVTLNSDAANAGDINLIGGTFTALDFNLGGSAAITKSYDQTTSSGVSTITYDGNAEAIQVYNNATEAVITAEVANLSASTGTNLWTSNGSAKLTYTGGSGADEVGGTAGADKITTGAGNDVVGGDGRTETYTIGSNANTQTFIATVNGVINTVTGNGILTVTQLAAALTVLVNADFATTKAVATSALGVVTVVYDAYEGTAGTATGTGIHTAAITGTFGAGNDTVSAGSGNDTIFMSSGEDDITTGSGTDNISMTDKLINNTGLSTAPSAVSIAVAATIAQGDTITFGNGVDVIRDFTSGVDNLVVSGTTNTFNALAPTTLIAANSGALAEDVIHGARGDFVEVAGAVTGTGVFTLSATGADFVLFMNDDVATEDVLLTNTNGMVLIGVTAMVAGDFT